MTPPDSEFVATSFGNLKFEKTTSRWFCNEASHQIEVVIGGGPPGPSEGAIQFAERLLPVIDQLEPEARKYLDSFVKKEVFAGERGWCLEGLLLEASPVASPDQFGLSFSNTGDIYGYWTVVFRELPEHERKLMKSIAWPVAFHRQQV